jgi:signal peptidase II
VSGSAAWPKQAAHAILEAGLHETLLEHSKKKSSQAGQLHFRSKMKLPPNQLMALVALVIFAFDQATKFAVLQFLGYRDEYVVIEGFFRFVHWVNTGAAWSFFKDHNDVLAVISALAMVILYLTRHHFGVDTRTGQIALGLLFGGILGNLTDRILPSRRHVIDFLYFYVNRRGGGEIGFPAFNVADSAICIGVGLLFLLAWQKDQAASAASTK